MNVGIDLGTTNSALAYIDPKQAAEADSPVIHVLEIPQYVAQGRIEARRTLPSFLYLGDQEYLGVFAREQGALAQDLGNEEPAIEQDCIRLRATRAFEKRRQVPRHRRIGNIRQADLAIRALLCFLGLFLQFAFRQKSVQS